VRIGRTCAILGFAWWLESCLAGGYGFTEGQMGEQVGD